MPDEVLLDGSVSQKYGYSARALMATDKYFAGLPFYRQDSIQKLLGVKIDNNRIEAMLKIVVRDRKNAMFHKTLLGTTIGDVSTSMIATSSESGINVFDYFTVLQRDKEKVKAHSENYLP